MGVTERLSFRDGSKGLCLEVQLIAIPGINSLWLELNNGKGSWIDEY